MSKKGERNVPVIWIVHRGGNDPDPGAPGNALEMNREGIGAIGHRDMDRRVRPRWGPAVCPLRQVQVFGLSSQARKSPPVMCWRAPGRKESISRILFPWPPAGVWGDDHSSSSAVASGIQRPTRGLGRAALPSRISRCGTSPPYLALLRVGFTLPSMSPSKRCALTAPFHPYLSVP